MELNYITYCEKYFGRFISEYGFRKHNELNYDSFYSIEYISTSFILKMEKYRREFYTTLYKVGHPDEEINLFNLLQYLYKDLTNAPEAKYFNDESNTDESYRKQIKHIADTIYNNFISIDTFFNSDDYSAKLIDIRRYMIEKYPDLFKRM